MNDGSKEEGLFQLFLAEARDHLDAVEECLLRLEKQAEDKPFDMNCHKDTEGNVYDFGFGMNWKGAIKDGRGSRYRK